jgi:preprotein translocase subunit SecG
MTILINILLALWSLIALLMVLVILMQRPKSEGLGAAFGGGVTENIFGAQTTNVLVKFTGWLAGFFFVLTFALSVLYAHRSTSADSALRRELMKTPATAPASAPAVPGQSPAASLAPGSSVAPVASPAAPGPNATVVPSPGASIAPSVSPASSPPAKRKP